MLRFLLILLCFPLLAGSQELLNHTDAGGLKQGLWKRYYPNQRLMYEGKFQSDKPVGEWRRYHENGALMAILIHSEATDSVAARLFDLAGKLVAEGTYRGEKKSGLWTYFSEGRRVSEEEFADGLKSGTSRVYYPSGELLEEAEWKDNKKSGRYRAFFTSGKPFLECIYSNDQRNGFCVTYYPTGEMEVDAFYREDVPDGDWKYYSEKGEIRYTLHYSSGVLLNPEVLYETETRKLEEMERQGKIITDPEKYINNPTEYLLKNR